MVDKYITNLSQLIGLLNNVASCTEQTGDKPMAVMIITVGDASEKLLQQGTSPSRSHSAITALSMHCRAGIH